MKKNILILANSLLVICLFLGFSKDRFIGVFIKNNAISTVESPKVVESELPDIDQLYLKAYTKIYELDEVEGKLPRLQLANEALSILLLIREYSPSWNSKIVNSRISKLEKIKKGLSL